MKRNNYVVTSAKVTNVFSAGLMFLVGLMILLFPEMESLPFQHVIFCILFALIGSTKLFGYFSNDLYRLAFQFDLAIGVFCEILAVLILFVPSGAVPLIPSIVSVYVILDSLLKVQTALDARRFGMTCWLAILLSSLLLCVAGGVALAAVLTDFMRIAAAVGIALMMDGLVNAFITAYTVRIRARKKNVTEHYGIDE